MTSPQMSQNAEITEPGHRVHQNWKQGVERVHKAYMLGVKCKIN